MSNKQINHCSVCGIKTKMTFEHFPPKASGNNRAVGIKDHRHILPFDTHLHGKSIRSNRGLGGYCLCEQCNKNTGSWYARSYTDLVNQLSEAVSETDGTSHIESNVTVKPLNFLKQVLVMIQCADQMYGSIREITTKSNFITDKKSQVLSNEIRVYMYATNSPIHRFLGLSVSYDFHSGKIWRIAEFNFHPFGFVLCIDSHRPHPNMYEITHFKDHRFNVLTSVEITLPVLKIAGAMPGMYG